MAAESAVRIIFLGDSSQAVRSVSRLEGSFSTLGRTSKLLAGAIGVALVGGLVLATKDAINFQKQMELIHTQAGASTKEVERMSKALLGLAASVGTGPEDLAKGLFHIESAGVRGANALAILKAAAEGAKVGQADLETVTNALIGAFKSGVKGAGSMEHAMAVLNATVGAGNMRMSDLTAAMGTGLLSAARGVGISIQDVGAAVAELTVQNENASEAATRLQMAFLTMAAGTSKGDAALKSIGITQNKLALDMRSQGLIFALQDLQTHLQDSGKTAVEQTAVIADVFGRRSLKAILPLLQHLDDVRKRQDQINKTTANFGDAWVATQATVSFQLERAKAALQAAFIPIGTLMLPLVARLAQGVGDAAGLITQHMGQVQAASAAASRGIGEAWNQYAIPALRYFESQTGGVVTAVKQAWPQIRTTLATVGASVMSIFRSMGEIIKALFPVIRALGPEFKIALGIIIVGTRLMAKELAFEFKIVAAVIKAVAPVVAAVINGINRGFGELVNAARGVASAVVTAVHAIVSALSKVAGAVKTAFDIGPIGAMIAQIQALIGWVQKLIGWISKIHIPHIGGKGVPVAPGPIPGTPGTPRMAEGGFVSGQSGSPQLILAHAGEVILNPMQQAAFGGAAFFKQTFGFSEGGSSFAAGGIVGHKPRRRQAGKSPHSKPHRRNAVKGKSAAVKQILGVLDEIDENESNADRAYGQLVRQFDISQEQFIRTNPVTGVDYLSQPDIDQRVSEIDQLITARNNYLALLDEEKAELEKAIQKLKAAIAALVKAIKQEREQAAQDAEAIKSLGAQLGRTKDPKAKAQIQNQITARGNSRSKHLSNVGTLQGTLTEFRGSLKDVGENLNDTLPMDRGDVNLDISTLQAERVDVVGTALPSSGAGGGTAGGDQGAEIAALLAQIARLNLALGIQGAQTAIIGSFAKGTLNVPETGLALVHSGEQIVPAGQVRGGGGYESAPITVNLSLTGPLEPLAQFITATVDTPQVAQRISVRMGRDASARARSGRH